MSLLAQLKRRNAFRVGLFYIVSSWLLLAWLNTNPTLEEPITEENIRAIQSSGTTGA